MIDNKFINIHFIGVGGIGVSALARLSKDFGCNVSGSDMKDSDLLNTLKAEGLNVVFPHDASNIHQEIDLVVASSAIKESNPEYSKATELGIPVIKRAEFLALLTKDKQNLVVAGSHGKTTTSSILGHLYNYKKGRASFVIGGIVGKYNTNALISNHDKFVFEADESDGTFLLFYTKISAVTNIDEDHMEFYGSRDNLDAAFKEFIFNTNDICILNTDDKFLNTLDGPNIKSLSLKDSNSDIYVSQVRESNKGTNFVITMDRNQFDLFVPMFGEHNVYNAATAFAMAYFDEISSKDLIEALACFPGVARRQEYLGKIENTSVWDDYAHHPIEVDAILNSFKDKEGVVVVFQPHRYTRLKDHFDDFVRSLSEVDQLYIMPVYSAGEEAIDGINSEALLARLPKAKILLGFDDIINLCKNDGHLLCLGAGDISSMIRRKVNEFR